MVFLKKVYRYNKALAIGMLFFVLVQLFCFYKGGMVFSPWYNYGMYSEVIKIEPHYEVYHGGYMPVFLRQLSPQREDKMYHTIHQFKSLAMNDSLFENEIMRIFRKLHLPDPKPENFKSSISKTDFRIWYQRYQLNWSRSALDLNKPEDVDNPAPAYWNGNELFTPRGFFSDSNDNPIFFK
ncbi:MAG: hypothetical protein ABIX01_08640 [Chitinophagaceae bacterium]